MDERFERAPVGILEVDPDGTVREMNETAGDLLAADPDAAARSPVESVFPESVDASVPRAFETPPGEDRSIEEYYPERDRWLAVDIVPGEGAVGLYVRDVTDQRRTRKRVEQQADDLERLTMIHGLISAVLGDLVEASTREEIAETICTHLGGTDIYEFAWLGERELGTDDIVVRAAAGETGRTLDRIEACLDGDRAVPEERVIETGEPELVQPVGREESVPEPVRRATFADGLQSLLAIPLTYGASVYGVVGLYTAEQDAFSRRERESFGTLGEMAGFAVNASRHRTLLLSDRVVELRLRVTDPADPFVAATEGSDATLTLDGLVPQEGTILCYLTVDGAEPAAVAGSLAGADGTRDVRVVAGEDKTGSLEVGLTAETPLGRLITRGATVGGAAFDPEGGTVTVDVSPDEDVRRLADAITREFDAEVVAKREREQDRLTPQALRDRLDERLTERQRNALRTAFFANYFESPRGSTAEEVAGALDITGPTLLHHLRAGQRKLLAEVFDPDDDRPQHDTG